jgi:sulfur-carrier protein adenylyltransferase/sulfurtransferase
MNQTVRNAANGDRYSRHLLLPEVGAEGQRKIGAARVLIVGAGGLGSPVALYLAAAGVGTLGIVDADIVEESNLQRQILHSTPNVGKRKTESARERLTELNPHVRVVLHDCWLTRENAMNILENYDVIVDGSDNFATRYLVNDAAGILGKPLVYGSVFRFTGQVSVFDARQNFCYRCLYPTPPPDDLTTNCAESGVLGALAGIVGTLQATETLKIILGIGETLLGRLLLVDALTMRFETLELPRNTECPLCGSTPTIHALQDYDTFCTSVTARDVEHHNVSAADLAAFSHDAVVIIDVREAHERLLGAIPGSVHIPLGDISARFGEIEQMAATANEIVLYCASGKRSWIALQMLQECGLGNVKHLSGGINAYTPWVETSTSTATHHA